MYNYTDLWTGRELSLIVMCKPRQMLSDLSFVHQNCKMWLKSVEWD